MIGRTVDSYRIVSKLGQGGMGEVFLAEDTNLRRRVAIKFLPTHVSDDADAVARFRREAQAAAALEHSNIVAIYHVGTFEGRPYIVMALADGETLATRLARGPLPTTQASDIARQIADALATAHRGGVVHRDIKPANIVVAPDGRALVLDFGLATFYGDTRVTRADTTVGTAQYMAPEQIRGSTVDARADVFSFGAVLYEMLTGRQAFRGDHREAIFYSILNDTPAHPDTQGDAAREHLSVVSMRALSKDPAERYANGTELQAALRTRHSGSPARARSRAPLMVGIVAALVAITMTIALRDRGRSPEPGAETARIPLPPAKPLAVTTAQLTVDPRHEEWPAFSPDGTRIAYVTQVNGFREIFVRPAGSGEATALTDDGIDHIQPTWSPDGQSITFVQGGMASGRLAPGDVLGYYFEGGDICKLDIATRRATRIVINAFSPAYSPDGTQLAFDAAWAGPRRIWVSDSRGTNPKQITTDASEAVTHVDPSWSPHGTRIAYRRLIKTRSDIEVIDLQTQNVTRITDDWFLDLDPTWSPDGRYVYFSSYRGGGLNLWRVPIDGERVGAPEQVTTGAGDDLQPCISPDGTRLAFSVLALNSDLWRLPIDPETGAPTGAAESLVATTREDSRGSWSPDGRTIAFNSDRDGNMNVWLHSLDDGHDRALTTGPGGDYQADWSPDGNAIIFFSSRSGNTDVWIADIAGGPPRQLTSDPALDVNPFYSPDGARIAFHSDRGGRAQLWVMNADGSNVRRVSDVEVNGHFMRWFADGRRILFASGTGTERVIYSVTVDDGTLEQMPPIKSGAHMSFSPDDSQVLEVAGHKALWVYPLDGSAPIKILEFSDPDIRIDYPQWSPDGRWAVFDRVAPQGGDIWLLDGLQ